jgi:zinc/manganese transport system ATP-binding protein
MNHLTYVPKTMKKAKLELSNITVCYNRHPAVHHLSISFKPGLNAIWGPNGGGKSTLLKALKEGLPLSGGSINSSTPLERIAYLPQNPKIDRSFPISVFKFAMLGLWKENHFFKFATSAQKNEVKEALEKVGLANYEARNIDELSDGLFQRLLFARVYLQKENIILLDEPFNNLDFKTTMDLLNILKTWKSENRIIVMVNHDIEQIKQHFDRVLMMSKTKLFYGDCNEIMTEKNIKLAHQLLNQKESPTDHEKLCVLEEEKRT